MVLSQYIKEPDELESESQQTFGVASEYIKEPEDLSIDIPTLSYRNMKEPEFVSTKTERAKLIKPTSMEQRLAQTQDFITADQMRQHEQQLINDLQSKIDKGEPIDPIQMGYYREYLDIPEPETQMRVPEKRETLTAKGWQPASKVGELPQEVDLTTGELKPSKPKQEPPLISPVEAFKEQWKTSAYLSTQSAFGTLLQMGLSTIKGVEDLNRKIPTPQFIKNVRNKIANTIGYDIEGVEQKSREKLDQLTLDTALYRKQIGDEIRKEGGMAAEVAQNIGDEFLSSAVALTGLGALKLFGEASTVKESLKAAAKLAGITYATTEGDTIDRAKAATGAGLFMLTPIPAGRMAKNWSAKLVNTALNFGVDLFTGKIGQAVTEAKNKAIEKGEPDKWKEELTTTLTPALLLEGAFGLLARAKTPQQINKVKSLYNELPPEILDSIKKVSPEMRMEWEKTVATEELAKGKEVSQKQSVNAVEVNILKESGIPKKEIGDYISDQDANGATLRKHADAVNAGEETVMDAAKTVANDWQSKKAQLTKEPPTEMVNTSVKELAVIDELKPLLEHPISYYVIADKTRQFKTAKEFESFVKYARAKSMRKADEWTSYNFEEQFGSIPKYFEWINSNKDNVNNIVNQYEKLIDSLNIDEKTKSIWKKDPENFELNYESWKLQSPTKGEQYAEGIRTETEKPSSEQKLVGGEEERLRVRNIEKNRVGTDQITPPQGERAVEPSKPPEKVSEMPLEAVKTGEPISEQPPLPPSAPTTPKATKEVAETPVSGAPETTGIPTKPEAEAGALLSVNSKVKIGKSPQVNTILEKLPQSDIERENGEQYFRIKNDKTGIEETVEQNDITPITLRQTGTQQVKETMDLNKRLQELGLEPSVFRNKQDKQMAIKREETKNEEKKEKLLSEMPVSAELKRKRGLRNRMGAIGFEKPLEIKTEQIDDVSKTQSMFNKQREDVKNKYKITMSKIRDDVSSAVFGTDIPITRRLMENNGKDVVIAKVLSRGWREKSKDEFNDAETYIKENIPHKMDEMFNDFIQANRTIEVSNLMREKRGTQKELFAEGELPEIIKSPGGLGAKENRTWLEEVKKQYPTEYKAMEIAQKRWNETMRSQIDKLLNKGLIDKDTHAYLVKNHPNFSPRKFIQYIDPSVDITVGTKKISVSDSGLETLDTGSDKSLINDTSYLLADTISRIDARIAKNEANKELYKYAQENKENIIGIKIETESEAEKSLSPEQTRISVMIDGKPKTMVGDTDIMKYWIESDPHIKAQTANVLQWLTGVKVVKAMATGYNPEFALYNVPRDMFHYWFTQQEYSKHLPIAWTQQLSDIITVLPDVVKRTGRAKEYVNEGGGMSFLSSQGRLGKNKSGYSSIRNEALRQVENVAGWLGNTSELLTRIALRERAIKNGKSKKEATYIARTALDFSQGGSVIKTLDTFVPYLNASVQGTRNVLDTFKTNPKVAIYKVAQLIGLGAVIEMMNHYMNKEANDSVPDAEKVSKFIFTTPINKKDRNGNRRFFYIPVPKDQGQQLFSIIGQELANKYLTGKVSYKRIGMALGNFMPADVQTSLPPIISALLGYISNKDFWSNKDIWEGRKVDSKFEQYATTPEAWRKTGEITGLSPERLRVSTKKLIPNNPFIQILGGLQSPMETADDDTVMQRLFTLMSEIPLLRRYMKTTFTTDLTEDDKKEAIKRGIKLQYPDKKDKPNSLIKSELIERDTEENNLRQLNDIHLDILAGQIRKKQVKPDEFSKWVNTIKDSKEANRIVKRMKEKYRNLIIN
jgi:hypothetical protein